jgi:hypothetical protein
MPISRALRHQLRSRVRNNPRASCCVIVLAPRTTLFSRAFVRAARLPQQVHAVMPHESAVLGGDDRGGDGRRHPVERHPDLVAPRLRLERRDLTPSMSR